MWLNRIADELEIMVKDVGALESLDTGKTVALATQVDAARSVSNFRFFADFGASMKDDVFEDGTAVNTVLRKPVGLVGLITPWNLPL